MKFLLTSPWRADNYISQNATQMLNVRLTCSNRQPFLLRGHVWSTVQVLILVPSLQARLWTEPLRSRRRQQNLAETEPWSHRSPLAARSSVHRGSEQNRYFSLINSRWLRMDRINIIFYFMIPSRGQKDSIKDICGGHLESSCERFTLWLGSIWVTLWSDSIHLSESFTLKVKYRTRKCSFVLLVEHLSPPQSEKHQSSVNPSNGPDRTPFTRWEAKMASVTGQNKLNEQPVQLDLSQSILISFTSFNS